MSETNYQRYFGTPEKAAEWLCYNIKECPDCEYFYTDKCGTGYLEWLESEAE